MLHKKALKGDRTSVTFILPTAIQATSAYVVGSFNDWDRHATPMKQLKDGRWKATVPLARGEHHYRFLVNGKEWHNDWEADKYAVHPYGGENSVVVV